MSIRAVIYARVSSAAQRDAHTIENQLRVLPAFVAAQGWTLVGTYVDDGRSAKTGQLEKREGFARLLVDAAARKFDVLVVVDVDRLTRSDDMIEQAAIIGPFQRAGIRIVSPSGGEIDLSTMLGQLDVHLRTLFAAEENRKRAERIKAGKLRAIAEGRKPAGPTPYGLAYSRATGTWSIDELAAAVVREIFRRVAGGESCVAIAETLAGRDIPAPRTGWSHAAVYRIVRNRTAIGEWSADKARGAVIRVPAIVTEEEWHAAQQALMRHRRRGLRHTIHTYLLEGIATCGGCGARIMIRSAMGDRRCPSPAAYICRGRKVTRTCIAPIVRTAEVDEAVWSALCDELEQPDLLDALADIGRERAGDVRDWRADADGYRAHLARLERVEIGVMARYRREQLSEGATDAELAAINRERSAVRAQLAAAERAIGATLSAQDRLRAASATVEQLRAALPLATPEQRRALLRELAHDGGVVITEGRARLDLRLVRPAAAASRAVDGASRLSLVQPAGYRMQSGAMVVSALRIRRLA